MGLFSSIKQVIALRKQFKDSFKEQIKKEAAYLQMSTSELSQLSVSSKEDLLEGFLSLNE